MKKQQFVVLMLLCGLVGGDALTSVSGGERSGWDRNAADRHQILAIHSRVLQDAALVTNLPGDLHQLSQAAAIALAESGQAGAAGQRSMEGMNRVELAALANTPGFSEWHRLERIARTQGFWHSCQFSQLARRFDAAPSEVRDAVHAHLLDIVQGNHADSAHCALRGLELASLPLSDENMQSLRQVMVTLLDQREEWKFELGTDLAIVWTGRTELADVAEVILSQALVSREPRRWRAANRAAVQLGLLARPHVKKSLGADFDLHAMIALLETVSTPGAAGTEVVLRVAQLPNEPEWLDYAETLDDRQWRLMIALMADTSPTEERAGSRLLSMELDRRSGAGRRNTAPPLVEGPVLRRPVQEREQKMLRLARATRAQRSFSLLYALATTRVGGFRPDETLLQRLVDISSPLQLMSLALHGDVIDEELLASAWEHASSHESPWLRVAAQLNLADHCRTSFDVRVNPPEGMDEAALRAVLERNEHSLQACVAALVRLVR